MAEPTREFDLYKFVQNIGNSGLLEFKSPTGGLYIVEGNYEYGASPNDYRLIIHGNDTIYFAPGPAEIFRKDDPEYRSIQRKYRKDMGYNPYWVPIQGTNKGIVESKQEGGELGEADSKQLELQMRAMQTALAAQKDPKVMAQLQEEAMVLELIKQYLSSSDDVEVARRGTKLKKAGCGCKATLKRVGGKLVNVDCNGKIVK